MNYAFSLSPAEIFREHLEWGRRFADPLTPAAATHPNPPDPERRLRVGYVSGDFRMHVVSIYITPVFEAHDRSRVEVFGYSNAPGADITTRRLRDRTDHWREINELSDAAAAEAIRRDGIDILVDLNGHTAHNRLLLFARKPAPVQVSWLGYVNTTGMQAMDYRLADPYTSPPGESDLLTVEKLVRLPGPGSCYLPPDYCPLVNELPAKKNGFVTFGSSNNPGKISAPALEAWCRILRGRPGSKLQLNFPSWKHAEAQQEFLRRAAGYGVTADRIQFLYTDHYGNLASYHDVDIALDPFPYNGSTTSLESFWMGVPVLALAGGRMVSRIGMTCLQLLDLPEWIAASPQEYVSKGIEFSGGLERLAQIRAGLRMRMAASPLTDVAAFTRNLESAYREMWRKWCAARGPQ